MTPQHTHHIDPILRVSDVQVAVGLSRARIYELVAQGIFPRPFKLTPGGRASGWQKSTIDAYIAERVASSRSQAA